MIDFYTWATPNGTKVAIMLEECGLPYDLRLVDLTRGEQRSAAFRALNPNGKIPVIADDEGPGGERFMLSESAAIVMYLAEKTGRFRPGGLAWHRTVEWTMFQMSAIGPVFGQLHHFRGSAPPNPYALGRFEAEGRRLLGVLDARLAESAHLAGPDYGIADICTWPWIRSWQLVIGLDLAGFPHVARWFASVGERPAVRTAAGLYDRIRAEVAAR